jgi:hypothetical protein
LKQGQWPRGLCRRCDRALGTFTPRPATRRVYLTDKQERGLRRLLAAVDAERQRLAALRAAEAEPPIRERVIGACTFLVIWDGTRASPSLTGWPSREW